MNEDQLKTLELAIAVVQLGTSASRALNTPQNRVLLQQASGLKGNLEACAARALRDTIAHTGFFAKLVPKEGD